MSKNKKDDFDDVLEELDFNYDDRQFETFRYVNPYKFTEFYKKLSPYEKDRIIIFEHLTGINKQTLH